MCGSELRGELQLLDKTETQLSGLGQRFSTWEKKIRPASNRIFPRESKTGLWLLCHDVELLFFWCVYDAGKLLPVQLSWWLLLLCVHKEIINPSQILLKRKRIAWGEHLGKFLTKQVCASHFPILLKQKKTKPKPMAGNNRGVFMFEKKSLI